MKLDLLYNNDSGIQSKTINIKNIGKYMIILIQLRVIDGGKDNLIAFKGITNYITDNSGENRHCTFNYTDDNLNYTWIHGSSRVYSVYGLLKI